MTTLPSAALAAAEEIVQLLDECADVPSFKAGVAEIIARHMPAPAPEGEVEARQQMSDTKTPAPDVAREDDGGRPLPFDRDQLGRFVREAWVRWAQTQPNPKPSWLVSYDALDEPDKEADRQIGEAIARWTLIGDAARAALAPGGEREGDGWRPTPRGGAETDWWQEWVIVVRRLRTLEACVKLALERMDANLDRGEIPHKYLPPFAELAALRAMLSQLYEPPTNAPAPPLAPQEAGR